MDRFADLLVERGLVTPADLARAEEVRSRTDGRLAATLTRLGLVAEGDLADAFATSSERASASRADLIDPPQIGSLNRRFLARRSVVPLKEADGSLTVAMADPEDEDTIAALAFATSCTVEPLVATFAQIEEALGSSADESDDTARHDLSAGAADDLERLIEGESAAPVIRLVQKLLANAVTRRASDVHIEPQARSLAVRYRVDGRLIEVERHPDAFAAPVASRIKVMAGLDIAETRLPQDGRLRLTVRGREVDVRVSTSPTAWGESIVLRLLGRSEVPLDLERLGLPANALAALVRALDRPHGIILLTGPTGSGKTTTLYAAISRLRRPEVKILTVEDPVEVLLDGINQVQVRPEIDLSYAAALRAFLRQDPDILMIGEIRDGETAEIALRAALTGHLVLSTLHTNSAIGAFTRLADIGVEPYLTASTVIATIAQRLVRALCPDCRVPRLPSPEERRQFERVGVPIPAQIFEPTGCAQCASTGFAGRLPLIEVLEVDEELRTRIREGRTDDAPERRAPADTLAGHGLALVAAGRTAIGEVDQSRDPGVTAYRCMVLSAEGRTDWRMIEATDEQGAVARLMSDGLTPLAVRAGALSLADRLSQPVRLGGGLRLSEQSLLLTQLALLVRAGLPVDRSLDLLREQAPRAAQRDLIAAMVARVRAGGGLAQALDEAGSFPAYVTGVVRAAERGGRLGDALSSIAARLSESASTRRQLTTALTYPAAVLVATFLALALVLTTVVPEFEPVFAGEEAKLPTLTRAVLALSRTVDADGWLLLGLIVAVPLLLWAFVRSALGQALSSRYRARIPGLSLRDQYFSAQVTGVLGTLLTNGVAVVGALPLIRGAVGSRLWQSELQTVERQVREGVALSVALGRTRLMPSSAVRLLEVGERSGQLADTAARASEILTQAARARIERIVALANPIAIITLGGLVAMLVAGVMLGIFALGDFAG